MSSQQSFSTSLKIMGCAFSVIPEELDRQLQLWLNVTVLPALLENVSFCKEKSAFHTPVTSPSPFLSSSQTPPKAVFRKNIYYVIFLLSLYQILFCTLHCYLCVRHRSDES